MKVKVLTPKRENQQNSIKSQILTPNYVRQLNEKISYNTIQAQNKREVGKKELVLKSKF